MKTYYRYPFGINERIRRIERRKSKRYQNRTKRRLAKVEVRNRVQEMEGTR